MKFNKSWKRSVMIAGPLAALVGIGAGWVWHRAPSTHLSSAATQALAADGMTPLPSTAAPGFRLENAQGEPASLSQFHGKAVVLTFLDPVCWWDCPLQAEEMVEVNRLLGPKLAHRVELVAIDANPEDNSVQNIAAFDREHDLTKVANWTYLTGPLPTLKQIWHEYYEYVGVPHYGMIQHTDVFWLITPKGREAWLSNPSAQRQEVGGTSVLLATYIARMLHQSLPENLTVPRADFPPFLTGRVGPPVSVQLTSANQGWAVLPQRQGYTTLATVDGGSWHNVTPVGMSQRGGITVAPVSLSTAWALVGPYGYQEDPVVRMTTNGGHSWSQPIALGGTTPPDAVAPLAAASATKALALAGHAIWETLDGGAVWIPIQQTVPWIKNASLSLQPGSSQLWISGDGGVWVSNGSGRWRSVTLPQEAEHSKNQILALGMHWQNARQGGIEVAVVKGNQVTAEWDVTQNGGATWQSVTSAIAGTSTSIPFQSVGPNIYTMRTVGNHAQLWYWTPSFLAWHRWSAQNFNDGTAFAMGSPCSALVLTSSGSAVQSWATNSIGTTWIGNRLPNWASN